MVSRPTTSGEEGGHHHHAQGRSPRRPRVAGLAQMCTPLTQWRGAVTARQDPSGPRSNRRHPPVRRCRRTPPCRRQPAPLPKIGPEQGAAPPIQIVAEEGRRRRREHATGDATHLATTAGGEMHEGRSGWPAGSTPVWRGAATRGWERRGGIDLSMSALPLLGTVGRTN